MEKQEIDWQTFDEVLSESKNYNILEEEIDIPVQQEFFKLGEQLMKDAQNFRALSIEYSERVNDLFDPEIDDENKKKMLLVLSTLDKVDIFRNIESFAQMDTPIKKWATIALQQSRMLIQSSLLEEDAGIFISTGLGGRNGLLRYFCVFINKDYSDFSDFQKDILIKETNTAIKAHRGIVENFEFSEGMAQAFVLLPLKSDLKEIFLLIVNESNLYGNFLQSDLIITNVKRLTNHEIITILKERKKKEE